MAFRNRWQKILSVTALACVCSYVARADDEAPKPSPVEPITLEPAVDCLVEVDKLDGVFDFNSDKIEKKLSRTLDQYHLNEKVQLKGGSVVGYREGGCAHFSMSFSFELNASEVPSGDKAILELVLNRLDALPIKRDDRNSVKVFHKALKRTIAAGNTKFNEQGIIPFPCGTDANCEAVKSTEPEGNARISINYDLPL